MLVTSAGRRNQLIGCFRDDAARLGLALRVIAADLNPALSPACQVADSCYAVPKCTEPDYIPALLEICRNEGVSLLVPTIDTELAALSEHAREFSEEGVRVVISSTEVVRTAADKLETARLLAAAGVSTPGTLTLAEYRAAPDRLSWPLIAKPVSGSASIGIVKPAHREELLNLDLPQYIVQECLTGPEYTVNLFFDVDGTLRCAVPHARLEVRAGEVSKGRTELVPALMETATKIAAVMPGARGPLCFQAILRDNGDCGVFEINARFGGGYPLAHRAGARFSQWLLEEVAGLPVSAQSTWRTGVTMLRFDDAVYLDG